MGLKTAIGGKPQSSESHSQTESGNHAWEPISQAFSPALGYVTQGGNAISTMLGLGGDSAAQRTALDNFSNSTGMGFLRDQINNQVTSNKAASGLLNSGSMATALQDRGAALGSTFLNNYMQNLFGLGNLGIQAGGVMSDAGKWSKGTEDSKGSGPKKGLMDYASDAAKAYAASGSDPRLKTDVIKVGELPNGLGVYEWTYRQDTSLKLPEGRYQGIMAPEVAKIAPKYLGPTIDGYMTVHYQPKRIG